MELEDSYKLQVLREIVQKNIDRIQEIEDIERELALSRWLHDSFEEMSFGKPEFRDLFHREMHSLRKTLHQLEAKYTENKFDVEKRRVMRQNSAIEAFLINAFSIDIDILTGRKKPAWIAAEQPAPEPQAEPEPLAIPEPQAEPVHAPAQAVEAHPEPAAVSAEIQMPHEEPAFIEVRILPNEEETLFPSYATGRSSTEKPKLSKIAMPVDMPAPAPEKAEETVVRISDEELRAPVAREEVEEEPAEEQAEEPQQAAEEHIEQITSIDMPPPPPEYQQESAAEKEAEAVSELRGDHHRHRKVEKLNLNLASRTRKISLMESGK